MTVLRALGLGKRRISGAPLAVSQSMFCSHIRRRALNRASRCRGSAPKFSSCCRLTAVVWCTGTMTTTVGYPTAAWPSASVHSLQVRPAVSIPLLSLCQSCAGTRSEFGEAGGQNGR